MAYKLPDSRSLRFAVVNLVVEFGQVEANLARIESWVARLAAEGAQVVAFPEMSLCGYAAGEEITPYLQPLPGPATQSLQHIAARYGVLLLAGQARQQAEERYISQVAVSGEGVLAVYDKIFLSPHEAAYYTPGTQPCLVPYDGWSIGLQLCYDSHFPALSAAQALAGADILYLAFATPHESIDAYSERLMRYLPARAYDNSCYLISCNQSRQNRKGRPYPGFALAMDPKGRLIGQASGCESYLLLEFEKEPLEKLRANPKAHFIRHHRAVRVEG